MVQSYLNILDGGHNIYFKMQKFVVFIVLIIALLQVSVKAEIIEKSELLGFTDYM